MMIAEVPRRSGRMYRLATIGSCRVHNPLRKAIRGRGGAFLWSRHNGLTHSAAAAVQNYDIATGAMTLSDALAPYVLREERAPTFPDDLTVMARECHAIAVEISSFEALRIGDVHINVNYLNDMFVGRWGRGVLDWMRGLGPEAPDPARVAAAEAEIVAAQGTITAAERMVLHDLRRERMPDEAIRDALRTLAGHGPALTILPIFRVPDASDHIDRGRAEIARICERIARDIGAAFLDPSPIVAEAGRVRALENDGHGIHHYAPDFEDRIGPQLLRRIIRG